VERTGIPEVVFIAPKDVPKAQQGLFRHDWPFQVAPSPLDFKRAKKERPLMETVAIPGE
jgi:hypothetical protein